MASEPPSTPPGVPNKLQAVPGISSSSPSRRERSRRNANQHAHLQACMQNTALFRPDLTLNNQGTPILSVCCYTIALCTLSVPQGLEPVTD